MGDSSLAWRPSISSALVEKVPQRWNSLLRMDLAIFQRRLSLCVAVLTKLFQDITHYNLFPFYLTSMIFVIWANKFKKKIALQQYWSTKKKAIFPLKTALLGESQGLVRWLSNQISSFRLVCLLKFFYLSAINIYVTQSNSRLFTYGLSVRNPLKGYVFQLTWKGSNESPKFC